MDLKKITHKDLSDTEEFISASFLPVPRRQHRPCGAICAATGVAWTRQQPTRRSSPFSWRRARPWTSGTATAWELRSRGEPQQVVPPTPAVLRLDPAACCSIRRQRGERQAAVGSEGLSGHQGQLRLGASADITTVLKTVFHRQSQ